MSNSILTDIRKQFSSDNYLFQIIIINAFVFVGLNIIIALTPMDIHTAIMRYVGLSANLELYGWRIWTIITYMFTHIGIWHLASNLIWLYWMGLILEDLYGKKRILELYLLGGIAGGIAYLLAYLLGVIDPNSYLIGASAGVMSIMVAIGILQPNYKLRLILIGEVSLKYIVLFGFLFSSVVDLNMNTGGKLAHFGGAIYGAIWAYYLPKGIDVNSIIMDRVNWLLSKIVNRPKVKVVHRNDNMKTHQPMDQEKVNEILDKISKSGYDSLSKSEKDYLFKFGKK